MDNRAIDESGRMKSWIAFVVALVALVLAIGNEAAQFISEREEERARLVARLNLPKTADFFEVTHARIEVENGQFVVYSDGRAIESFSGRFRVDVRDMDTARHAWTPSWSPWIKYRKNSGPTRYSQPESITWWTGRDDAAALMDPSRGWVMQTCWQGRVDDPVLGLTELEPVCVSDDVGGRVRMQIEQLEQEVRRLKRANDAD